MISMSFVLAWKLQTKKNAIKASFLIGKRHQELNKGATRSHKRHQSSVLFPFQIFFFRFTNIFNSLSSFPCEKNKTKNYEISIYNGDDNKD